MPVPSLITDLTTVAATNSPTGSESPATADDYFRAHASFIAQLRDSAFGAWQTWQDVTASRALGVIYTNSTGRAIVICVTCSLPHGAFIQLTVNGLNIGFQSNTTGGVTNSMCMTAIIPDGATYKSSGSSAHSIWMELRA